MEDFSQAPHKEIYKSYRLLAWTKKMHNALFFAKLSLMDQLVLGLGYNQLMYIFQAEK